MNREKVSLLMTTYNCREQFAASLESALSQDYRPLELVIKDGGSTDGTAEEIQAFRNAWEEGRYPGIDLVCESSKDGGIYDAMNWCVKHSTGSILAVFNDLFTRKDAVRLMVSAIEESGLPGAHADLIYADGEIVKRYWHMGNGSVQFGWMPAHPTLYLKREIYDRYGLYDVNYDTSADFEFMLRFLKNGEVKLAYVPKVLIRMFWGGTSNGGGRGYGKNIREAYDALRKNHVPFPAAAIGFRVLRTLLQYGKAPAYQSRGVGREDSDQQGK